MVDIHGVFNFGWRDKSNRLELVMEGLPDWAPILPTLPGRICYICFDSDSASKPMVGLAERRLAWWLTKHGAVVFIIRLQDRPDGAKQGLDDDLVQVAGQDRPARLQAHMETAEPWGSAGMVRKLQAENVELKRQLHELARLRRNPEVDSTEFRVKAALANEIVWWRNNKGKEGPCEINRDRMADEAGICAGTVGKWIDRIAKAPDAPITKTVKWRDGPDGEPHKVMLLDTRQPVRCTSEALALLNTPIAGKAQHGGKRTPRCPDHPDAELGQREILLHFKCGCVIPEGEALLVETSDNDEAADTAPGVKAQLASLLDDDLLEPDEQVPEGTGARVNAHDASLLPTGGGGPSIRRS
jgi:Domain of unknown function (DUF3854)